MYNLRARAARTTLAGAARPQLGMTVSASPAQLSQVTPTQATEILEETESVDIVPDTEITLNERNSDVNLAGGAVVMEEATQPPIPPPYASTTTEERTWDIAYVMVTVKHY